jgi:5-methylthioadenosine/S-adenosylhomocysteine deaminase
MRLDADGQPRNVSLLVSGGAVVTMNPERQVFVDGSVAVDGDAIVAVGERRELEAAITADQVVDAGGSAVIPGLVNAHTHGFQSLYRGSATNCRSSSG